MAERAVSTISAQMGNDPTKQAPNSVFEDLLEEVTGGMRFPADDAQSGMRGRRRERAVLDQLLTGVRAGHNHVLVLRGEAGIGKTALLRYLEEGAVGFRIARTSGVESEMDLAFSGLHQLCAPMLEHLDRLPPPQGGALSAAFGLSPGGPPDRFLVGLAVLSLLTDIAEQEPVLCIVDDSQWLDEASRQVLGFVARRLLNGSESVGLLFAARTGVDGQDLLALPEWAIKGLSDTDALALLQATLHGPIDVAVRDRIVAESHGNPLALLGLPRGLTPVEMAGGFGLPGAVPPQRPDEDELVRRIHQLPADTRRFLLAAAIEPVGDVTLLWKAAAALGIGPDAINEAEFAGLIEVSAHARFRHPLMRSAAYTASSVFERRTVHRALAEATDPELDPDRRAWHRAHSVLAGQEEAVATELELSVGRAERRGGLPAAAAFLRRAAELTLDPPRRALRTLAAAQAYHLAGATSAAKGLMDAVQGEVLDELHHAKMDLLRAQIALASRPESDAFPVLLAAAKQLEPLDIGLARDTYLEALSPALFVACRAGDPGELAKAALAAPPRLLQPMNADALLNCRAALFTAGPRAVTPELREVIRSFCRDDLPVEDALRWLWPASAAAVDIWDDDAWLTLSARHVKVSREYGALGQLPLALSSRAFLHLFAGELPAAALLIEEAHAVAAATEAKCDRYGALGLAAWRCNPGAVSAPDEGLGGSATEWARALAFNATGRYGDALTAAEHASELTQQLGFSVWSLVELIEAATRSGHLKQASEAFGQLSVSTSASGTAWALGVQARSRALLSDRDAAEPQYLDAIERLGQTHMRAELARGYLVYGEWLRRENRRLDARKQLQTAYAMFAKMGAEGFVERARRELLATGEIVRRRSIETIGTLTPQEEQIALLAGGGQTNPEIGAELFLSPRTVEWHLRKIYPKLRISSRKELRNAMRYVAGKRQESH